MRVAISARIGQEVLYEFCEATVATEFPASIFQIIWFAALRAALLFCKCSAVFFILLEGLWLDVGGFRFGLITGVGCARILALSRLVWPVSAALPMLEEVCCVFLPSRSCASSSASVAKSQDHSWKSVYTYRHAYNAGMCLCVSLHESRMYAGTYVCLLFC